MNNLYRFLFISLLLFGSCEEDINNLVTRTNEVSDLTTEGVTLNGEIISINNHPVTDYGFEWSADTEFQSGLISKINFGEKPSVGKFSYRLTDRITTGTTYYVRAFVLVGGNAQYSNVVSFVSLGSSAPVLLDFNPRHGASPDTITITGEHLGESVSNTMVSIGELNCEVLSTSLTKITFRIPKRYTAGSYPITVKAADKSATTSANFTLEGTIVESIVPSAGTVGTLVTITGSGFSTTPEENLVYFGGFKATVTTATPTILEVIVPVISEAGILPVSVEYNFIRSVSPTPFELTGPKIDSFSPASGPPGSQFTIYGSGFSPVPAENSVALWGGLDLEVISASQNELVVRLPEDIAAYTSETGFQWSLHLTVQSTSIVADNLFTVEGPRITGYDPSPQSEGRVITIYGKNLAGNGPTQVYFGYSAYYHNSSATIISNSAEDITVQIPFGSSSQPALPENSNVYIKVGSWTHISPDPFPALRPWTEVAGFPNVIRYAAVAFTVGAYSYYMTGIGSETDRNDVWRFDVANNTRKQLPDFPGQPRGFAFSFVIGGKAYVGGGGRYSLYAPSNLNLYDLWEFDPVTESWTQKSSFPETTSGMRFPATSIGDYGYFGVNNSLYRYDPANDTWTVTAVPVTFKKGGVAGSIGAKGYFGLGEQNSELWEFDPVADTWTLQQTSPFNLYPGWGPQTSFVINDKLYVTDYYRAMVFDPQTNQWEQIPYHTDDTTRDSWSFTSGDHAYLFIGRGKNAGILYKFDPNY